MRLTLEQRLDYIKMIQQFPAQLEALVSGLTDYQLNTPFIEGEWTVAQNVHHLFDSHVNSFIRLKLILTEDSPTIKPYLQDEWAQLADYLVPISVSLTLLHHLHLRWVSLFNSLTDAQWQRTGIHPESGIITPDDLVKAYAEHGEAHLDQIQRTLAAEYL